MKKTVLAFGASSSRASINKRFANYAARQLSNAEVILLDLNDFEMPIFSVDRERENGYPEKARSFKQHIKNADAIVISFAEHNGAYSSAFKNIFDWVSRLEKNVWNNNPLLLLSTSPGARGGKTVLEIAVNKLRRMTEGETVYFSLPSFYENFDDDKGIINEVLNESFQKQLAQFNSLLNTE